MTYHPRNGHMVCGSLPDHADIHQPKGGPEPIFHKPSGMCMPKHLQAVQEKQIKITVDKMSENYKKRQNSKSCFKKK